MVSPYPANGSNQATSVLVTRADHQLDEIQPISDCSAPR